MTICLVLDFEAKLFQLTTQDMRFQNVQIKGGWKPPDPFGPCIAAQNSFDLLTKS